MDINISISQLKEILKGRRINLIDIRSNYKYSLGTIEGAINIVEDQLLYNFNRYLDKNQEYYIFCDTGKSSGKLANILNSLGYKVYNISGGYNKYVLEK